MPELYGLRIATDKNVYEPSDDSFMAIEALEKFLGSFSGSELEVLDMGTGTGVIGLYAAKDAKVAGVVLADINPTAVSLASANAKENAALLHAKVKAVRSDLFGGISGKFDIITFNAPYLRRSPFDHGALSKAWNGGREGIEVSLRFLDQARGHMKGNAAVILLASSLGNVPKLASAIEERGGTITDTIKRHFFFEDLYAFTIIFRESKIEHRKVV